MALSGIPEVIVRGKSYPIWLGRCTSVGVTYLKPSGYGKARHHLDKNSAIKMVETEIAYDLVGDGLWVVCQATPVGTQTYWTPCESNASIVGRIRLGRVSEAEAVKASIGSPQYKEATAPVAVPVTPLSDLQVKICNLKLSGKVSVEDLAAKMGVDDFKLNRSLGGMVKRGIIRSIGFGQYSF